MLRIALLILACVAGIHGAAAQSRPEQPVASLDWRSTAGNKELLARDIEQLYLALYNTGNLAVRQVKNTEGVFVERLMRNEGLFDGPYFPRGLDNLLCDLNQSICSRRRSPVPPSELTDVTSHVGGYSFSEPVWAFDAGATVMLPDYKFNPFTTIQKVQMPFGWSADDYLPEGNVDCSLWRVDCAELVRSLNPALVKAPEKGDVTAVLPATGFETRIQLKADSRTTHADTLSRLGSQQQNDTVSLAAPDLLGFSSRWSEMLAHTSGTDLMVRAIEDNIVAVGRGMKFSVRDEPMFDQQVDLFKLIAHPFTTKNEDDLEDIYKNPVNVLLLDEALGSSHCDLPPSAGDVQSTGGSDSCIEIAAAPHPFNDHAAHVFGIISAPINGRGMVGLNPWAHITLGTVNTEFSAPGDFDGVNFQLLQAVSKNVRVANLSWGFDRDLGGDVLEAGITGLEKTILIVAAAGNQHKDLEKDNCRIFPACMHELSNVITVIGLNRDETDPAPWEQNANNGSNSSPFFHIAAIADNVLSTVGDNKLGHMSGTSQAAPQVTAAASLIYSAAEDLYPELIAANGARLAPKIVKDRLIYTADLFLSLGNKVVQSGRLNINRAINIVDAQLILQRAGDALPVNGRIVQIPNDILTCEKPGSQDEAHSWDSIRRLYYEPHRKRYIIFKHEEINNLYSKLLRIDGCNLTSRSHVGKIVPADNTEVDVDFKMSEIVDYTSTLLE
jgi:hypothetical protein